jgi:hypothetical protein
MKTLQWMVIDSNGEFYAASNDDTQTGAKERHYSDTGETWHSRYQKGDRLVQVSISIIKTLP